MKRWDEYLFGVAPSLPDCPEIMQVDAIKDAAIAFCEHTYCWQDTLDVRVVPSDRDIELTTNDDDIQIVRVEWIGGDQLNAPEAKTLQWLDDNVWNWRYDLGTPVYYTMPLRGTVLWLAPHPAIPITLDVLVSLKPGRASIEGPEDLFADYQEAIQSGAMSRLMMIPGRAWSNPQLAIMHNANWMRWRDIAMARASRGNTRAPIRIKANYRW